MNSTYKFDWAEIERVAAEDVPLPLEYGDQPAERRWRANQECKMVWAAYQAGLAAGRGELKE